MRIIIYRILFISLLTLLVSCAMLQGKSSPSQYSNDVAITTTIKARLLKSDLTPATQIHVETLNGIVQLSGFVSSDRQSIEAERIALGAPLVKGVVNDIVITPPKKHR